MDIEFGVNSWVHVMLEIGLNLNFVIFFSKNGKCIPSFRICDQDMPIVLICLLLSFMPGKMLTFPIYLCYTTSQFLGVSTPYSLPSTRPCFMLLGVVMTL